MLLILTQYVIFMAVGNAVGMIVDWIPVWECAIEVSSRRHAVKHQYGGMLLSVAFHLS